MQRKKNFVFYPNSQLVFFSESTKLRYQAYFRYRICTVGVGLHGYEIKMFFQVRITKKKNRSVAKYSLYQALIRSL